MNNTTNINKQQIKLGSENISQLYTIEGIITKYISKTEDTILSDPNSIFRFIVKDPDASLTSKGANNNDICIKNNNQYFFFKPQEGTTILFIPSVQILHFKNNQWNIVYTFSTGGSGSLVDEPPSDSRKYGRKNNSWVPLDDINDVPVDNKTYVRKNKTWEIINHVISTDVPLDNKVYGRKDKAWVETIQEAPNDGKQYARKNGQWSIISIENSGLFVPEPNNDGKLYARRYNQWDLAIEEAPSDNNFYSRRNKDWYKNPIQNDASNDGNIYGRKNNEWVNISDQVGITEAPNDGNSYLRKNKNWISTTLIEDTDIDNKLYFRSNKTWVEYIDKTFPDVEIDHKIYGRKNKSWVEVKSSPIDTDAPSDNYGYVRRNKTWTKVINPPFTEDAPQTGKIYGRKDGNWEEVISGSGSGGTITGNHNELSGIQGGKVVGTEIEAYHLTREEYERIPYKPTIISPSNNSNNINQIPQIVGDTYRHPFDYPMYGMEVIISKNSEFTDIIYTYNGYNSNTVYQVPEKQNNNPVLETATSYWVKIRYQDNRRKWSSYSDPIKFETMIQFPTQILNTPIMISPSNGGVISDTNPVLFMSQPSVSLGAANFVTADYQIASDSEFTNLIYNKTDSADLSLHLTENVNLAVVNNADIYVRGRQKTDDNRYTNWTNPSKCKLNPAFDAEIFGVRRVFNKENEIILCNYIDETGNVIFPLNKYIKKHPLFQLTEYSEISFGDELIPDSGYYKNKMEFVFIPPIYMKHNIYNNESGDLVIDVWLSLSNQSGTGWYLHPAFLLYPNGIYYSSDFCNCYCAYSQLNSNNLSSKKYNNINMQSLKCVSIPTSNTNIMVDMFNEKNYNLNNIYIQNIINLIYLFYTTLPSISYNKDSLDNLYKFLLKFFYFVSIYNYQEYKNPIIYKKLFYDHITKSYKLSSPYIQTDFTLIVSDDSYEETYSVSFNGEIVSGQYSKILDIYQGPMLTYNSFDIALLNIPKEVEFTDLTKKSPFGKYQHNSNSINYPVNNKEPYVSWEKNSGYMGKVLSVAFGDNFVPLFYMKDTGYYDTFFSSVIKDPS